MKIIELKEKTVADKLILEVLYVGNKRKFRTGQGESECITLRLADRTGECNLDCYNENIVIAENLKVGDMVSLTNAWCKHFCTVGKFNNAWDLSTGQKGKIEKI